MDRGKFNSILCGFQPATKAMIFRTVPTSPANGSVSRSSGTRLSKAGNARLCTALYRPAIRFNTLGAAFYERLVAAGKAKMAVLGVGMRKLLMIADGVLKSCTRFDPSHGEKQGSRQHAIGFGV